MMKLLMDMYHIYSDKDKFSVAIQKYISPEELKNRMAKYSKKGIRFIN